MIWKKDCDFSVHDKLDGVANSSKDREARQMDLKVKRNMGKK